MLEHWFKVKFHNLEVIGKLNNKAQKKNHEHKLSKVHIYALDIVETSKKQQIQKGIVKMQKQEVITSRALRTEYKLLNIRGPILTCPYEAYRSSDT